MLETIKDAFARQEGLIVISQSEFSTNAMGLRVSLSYWLHGDKLLSLSNILRALKMNSPFILRSVSVSAFGLQLCPGARARPTVHFS